MLLTAGRYPSACSLAIPSLEESDTVVDAQLDWHVGGNRNFGLRHGWLFQHRRGHTAGDVEPRSVDDLQLQLNITAAESATRQLTISSNSTGAGTAAVALGGT